MDGAGKGVHIEQERKCAWSKKEGAHGARKGLHGARKGVWMEQEMIAHGSRKGVHMEP